jgi:hypothetical protein
MTHFACTKCAPSDSHNIMACHTWFFIYNQKSVLDD